MNTQTTMPESKIIILKARERVYMLRKRTEAIKDKLPKNWISIAEAHYPEFEKSKYRDAIKDVRRGRIVNEQMTDILENIANGVLTLENVPLSTNS